MWLRFLNKRNLLISTNIEVFTGNNLMYPFILLISITRKTLWLLNMLVIACKSWICIIDLSTFIICNLIFLLCIYHTFTILPHTHRIYFVVLELLRHFVHWSRCLMVTVLNVLVKHCSFVGWAIASCCVTSGICACTCHCSTFMIAAVSFVWISSLAQSILLRLLFDNIPVYFVPSSWYALLLGRVVFLWFLLILRLVNVLHFLYILQLN